jgi:pimeloyl-ACP methyl ester carboxylesterase
MAAAGVAGAAANGASAGTMGAPAAGSSALPLPPVPAPLVWTRCGSYECSTLKVPLDYAAPSGETIELALKRRRARGQRIGSLLINPGGPGGSAVDFLAGFVAGAGGTTLGNRFDIVAFDPRGIGASTPLDCHATVQQLVATDPTPDDEAEWSAFEREAKTFAEGCARKHAALLPHLATPNVARDMDQVRAALGDDELTYLGFSYGTAIGAWYAELFPQRVRALVLDGAVDLRLSAIELSLQQAKGFEAALATYFAWCGESASNCAWTAGRDPAQALQQLMASVDASPIPAPGSDRPVGPGELLLGVIAPLYGGVAGYRSLSSELRAAASGDGSMVLALVDGYLDRRSDGSYGNIQEANYAVNCLDLPVPSLAAIRGEAARFAQEAPTFGVAILTSLLVCAHWPAMSTPPPPPSGIGAAPVVVVGTTGDPATPYAWSQALASNLESAVLLTYEGEGHTAYGRGVPCIDDAVDAYLIEGSVPTQGTRCGAASAAPAMVAPYVRASLR